VTGHTSRSASSNLTIKTYSLNQICTARAEQQSYSKADAMIAPMISPANNALLTTLTLLDETF
jgi:hypothetical protein